MDLRTYSDLLKTLVTLSLLVSSPVVYFLDRLAKYFLKSLKKDISRINIIIAKQYNLLLKTSLSFL